MTTAAVHRLVPFLAVTASSLAAQALPRTTAERSDYAATSTTAEVGAFLDSLALAGAPISMSEMGTSALGRPILLVSAADPAVTSAAEACASVELAGGVLAT